MGNESSEFVPEIKLSFGEEPTFQQTDISISQAQLTPEAAKTEVRTIDDSMLSDDEKKQVKEFAQKINLKDTTMVLQFGVGAQKNISAFSETALSKMRTKDTGEVGNMLTNLTTELKGFSTEAEPKKGLFGMIKKSSDQLENLKTKYSSVETNIGKITDALESHKIQLYKDISVLDKMYEVNLSYYKELTMYILAGKEKLSEALQVELPALRQKAEQSGLPQDAQAVKDFEDMCNRFDKKLFDLDLTRTISMQMAPQIRLVQNNDSVMVEKIQTSIVNTIPLWKNQMVLSLGLANSQKALQAQRAVTDMTNQLLKKNADLLKTSTIEVAKETERSIVDIETIKYTNQQLISTLEEVIGIQEQGRQKRREAEKELTQIENELKQKLLSTSR